MRKVFAIAILLILAASMVAGCSQQPSSDDGSAAHKERSSEGEREGKKGSGLEGPGEKD